MSPTKMLWLSARHTPSLHQLETLLELERKERGKVLSGICVAVPAKLVPVLKGMYREEEGRLRRSFSELTVIPYRLPSKGDGQVTRDVVREIFRSGVVRG